MCKAFSALVTKSGKVYWKMGMDSHDGLVETFKRKDKELRDDKLPPENTFARVEITPKDENYLNFKQKWIFKLDEKVRPRWWKKSYKELCYEALKGWQRELSSQIKIEEALNPICPFEIIPPAKITKTHLRWLKEWVSVCDSAGDLVRNSVVDSVGDSVWESVEDSVWVLVEASVGALLWDLLWDSLGDSLCGYLGSLFPKIRHWEGCDRRKKVFRSIRGYPFRSAVKLWRAGLVPSFDGKVWRLHGGKKASVLWEGTVRDLERLEGGKYGQKKV